MPAPSIPATIPQFSTNANFSIPNPPSPLAITFDPSSDFPTRLSAGFVGGWTVGYPTTGSSFESAIIAAFSGYTLGGSLGILWLQCIGIALDAEVDLWVSSWQPPPVALHAYVPSAGSIIANIEGCQPLNSEATTKLNAQVANWFISNFAQEAG